MPPPPHAAGEEPDNRNWLGYYRNALLWHLEAHGLAKDWSDTGRVASECRLPEVDSIIKSLSVRHPTMTAEASALALVDESLPRTLTNDGTSSVELDHMQRRNHGLLSQQALVLRHFVMANVERAIAASPHTRLLRLLMIGTEHLDAACDLVGDVRQHRGRRCGFRRGARRASPAHVTLGLPAYPVRALVGHRANAGRKLRPGFCDRRTERAVGNPAGPRLDHSRASARRGDTLPAKWRRASSGT